LFRRIRRFLNEVAEFEDAKDKLHAALSLLPDSVDSVEGINWTKRDVDEQIELGELYVALIGLIELGIACNDRLMTTPSEFWTILIDVSKAMGFKDILEDIESVNKPSTREES
jgi:hypothetical protein